ncbi:MAG: hypothetical protein NTV55_10130 [Planctomycetota bacterium]|nr:hypothetical protein [Planctomycetota bacterium]
MQTIRFGFGHRLAVGLLAGLTLILLGTAVTRSGAQPPPLPGAPPAARPVNPLPGDAPAPVRNPADPKGGAKAEAPRPGEPLPGGPGVVETNIPKGPNDRIVVPGLSPQDPSPRINGADLSSGAGPGGRVLPKDPPGVPPVWVLHLKFKDPRFVKVKVPGKGERLCMYLWYQVYNFTGEPRLFIPSFELKSDTSDTLYPDQILPAVEQAVIRQEDPSGLDSIQNSVTISQELIPLSKADRLRPVTGLALWDEIPQAGRYTLFATGLSNGWSIVTLDQAGKENVVRRKTLQVDFRRLGNTDKIEMASAPRWIYRGGLLKGFEVQPPEKPAGQPVEAAPGEKPAPAAAPAGNNDK